MDGLKSLLAKKRKAAEEEFGGRKQVKRVDIEQARIKQLRTEEQHELDTKVKDAKRLLSAIASCFADLLGASYRKQNVHLREQEMVAESFKGLTLVLGPVPKRHCLERRSSDG